MHNGMSGNKDINKDISHNNNNKFILSPIEPVRLDYYYYWCCCTDDHLKSSILLASVKVLTHPPSSFCLVNPQDIYTHDNQDNQ